MLVHPSPMLPPPRVAKPRKSTRNEPITRIKVDEIRGISSAQMIRRLVAKGFVKEAGRDNVAGRPILYKTTDEFLDYFGLSSKEELPKIEYEEEEKDETDLFLSKYKERA